MKSKANMSQKTRYRRTKNTKISQRKVEISDKKREVCFRNDTVKIQNVNTDKAIKKRRENINV